MTVPKPTVLLILQNQRRRKGFSLTEIAIVLAVIGIILAAIWIAAGQVNEKARVTEAVNEFNAIAQNMTSLLQGGYGVSVNPCASAGATPCAITSNMITANVIAPSFQLAGCGSPCTAATHPWNPGGLLMWWVSSSPTTYRLSFYGTSLQGCIGLITQTTNCTAGQPGCPIQVTTAYRHNTYSLTGQAMTSTIAQNMCATTNCGPTGTGAICNSYGGGSGVFAGPNSIEFDFTQ